MKKHRNAFFENSNFRSKNIEILIFHQISLRTCEVNLLTYAVSKYEGNRTKNKNLRSKKPFRSQLTAPGDGLFPPKGFLQCPKHPICFTQTSPRFRDTKRVAQKAFSRWGTRFMVHLSHSLFKIQRETANIQISRSPNGKKVGELF